MYPSSGAKGWEWGNVGKITWAIIPQLTADTVYIANSYGAGYGAVSSTIKKVIPNQDYNFVYKMTESNGIIHDGSYASNNIHSAVNYGSTITIPVPENFLLNHDTTIKANTELGLIDKGNANSQITITQAGIGQDIIITVPKGRSKQGADGQLLEVDQSLKSYEEK